MRMSKVPEYPRPHDFNYSFAMGPDSTASRRSTMMPFITYDEGLGAMSAYESNPVNANFVEAATDHCYPTSRVDSILAVLTVAMSKVMLETDKVHAIKFQTATIHTAFDEGSQAVDELSTLDLNEILELDKESTDRQTYPLWNDIDLADYKSNAKLDMPAETPGLDTDLEIEAVAFSTDDYYDCLHYYTNGPKLRSICTPIQTHVLTRNRPTKTIFFRQQSNTKYLNPYTMLAGLIHIPVNSSRGQFGEPADTTIDTSNLQFDLQVRYNEFNHEFNHSML